MVERIGPYKFTGVLGRGGMGTVYKGEHEKTGEVHAVKVLAPNYSREDHFRARFESEIQALIKLDHPNIVRLISFGQESGNMFFAMEMVEGKSLFEVQRSGYRFTPPQCLAIAKDVCKGLKHAHDRGIIHRDLKPGNLMMTKDRVVKITDFGIAKSFGASQNTGNNILGTMDFMSPEQAKGEPVTARSDIYSLGTVLYTLLAGKPPFSASSIEESFRNLTRISAPHVSSVVPDVPDEVDQLLHRMMEKKPEKRIATAQATLHQINEAELLLKNYSEAKTATFDPQQTNGSKTSIVGRTGPATGKQAKSGAAKSDAGKSDQEKLSKPLPGGRTSVKGKTEAGPKADKTHLADPYETAFQAPGESGTDSGDFALQKPADKPDFFSTVTDEERAVTVEDHELRKSKGIVPLLLGLLGVILVAGVGTWFAMSNPSADELYTRIDQFRLKPERVVVETDQFVSLYPDDERVEEVRAMNEAGKVIDFYHDLVNKLSVRARIPGESRMTEVEDQFHDIVRLADNDISLADKKMEAFIFVHQGNEELDPRDRDCVQAAEGFRVKHQAADSNRIEQRILNIEATVKRAEGMVTGDAVKLYRSLVKLHQDENWGQQESVRVDLLAEIEQRIKDLADQ